MVKLHPLKIHTSFFLAKNHPLYPTLPLITPYHPLITPLLPSPKPPITPNYPHLSQITPLPQPPIIHHYPSLPHITPLQPFDQSPSNTSSTQHINRRQIQNTSVLDQGFGDTAPTPTQHTNRVCGPI